MQSVLRQYSVFVRRRRAVRECKQTLQRFRTWDATQRDLPPVAPTSRKLLVIRLDDIGDYLLFRNQLAIYKRSSRWNDHTVTLLGNASWKAIFTAFDSSNVDEVIWVDKRRYLIDDDYRWSVWSRLRSEGYETVIATSRTRPLLLDDLCMLAASPTLSVGSSNTYVHAKWNEVSDSLYLELFDPTGIGHEFSFNAQFATWACGSCATENRPTMNFSGEVRQNHGDYLLCFVGANTRSKRWPEKRWIEFVERFSMHHSDQVVVAGASAAEVTMAHNIQEKTGAKSIAGKVSLLELVPWVAGARAIITNDTMAAHLGVACRRPTLIIANGVNYQRFTEYASADIAGVTTVYPDRFNRLRQRYSNIICNYEDVVTADIASIQAPTVLYRLEELLNKTNAAINVATALAQSP